MPKLRTMIDRGDGEILGIDLRRLSEDSYFLLPNAPNNAIACLANQSAVFQPMTVSGDGPIEIVSFALQRTGVARVMIQLEDGRTITSMMNRSVHVDTIFGSYGGPLLKPYPLPESLYLEENRSLSITFTDVSGAPNTIRPALLGTKYKHWQRDPSLERMRKRMDSKQYLIRPFFYTFTQGPVAVGAGATVTVPIEISNDHHFKLFQLSGVSTGAYNLDLVNAITGESIIFGPANEHYAVDSALIVGTGQFPFKFHEPILLEAGTRLNVVLTDTSAAPNVVDLTLGGVLLTLRMWK